MKYIIATINSNGEEVAKDFVEDMESAIKLIGTTNKEKIDKMVSGDFTVAYNNDKIFEIDAIENALAEDKPASVDVFEIVTSDDIVEHVFGLTGLENMLNELGITKNFISDAIKDVTADGVADIYDNKDDGYYSAQVVKLDEKQIEKLANKNEKFKLNLASAQKVLSEKTTPKSESKTKTKNFDGHTITVEKTSDGKIDLKISEGDKIVYNALTEYKTCESAIKHGEFIIEHGLFAINESSVNKISRIMFAKDKADDGRHAISDDAFLRHHTVWVDDGEAIFEVSGPDDLFISDLKNALDAKGLKPEDYTIV